MVHGDITRAKGIIFRERTFGPDIRRNFLTGRCTVVGVEQPLREVAAVSLFETFKINQRKH